MADFSLGTPSTTTSNGAQLQTEPLVSGSGAPTHIPNRASQEYVDVATGRVWKWWAGAWH